MKNISVEQSRMQSELDKDDESDRSKFNLLQERVEELNAKLMKWRKKQDRENNADRLDDESSRRRQRNFKNDWIR